MGPLEMDTSVTAPEDRNRSSFQNIVFSRYLEFWMMDKVNNPSDPVQRSKVP
jgi:hypothetical protein